MSAAAESIERLFRDLATRTDTGGGSPEELLGAAYEGSLDAGARRAGGIHYTPRDLVERVVERALGELDVGTATADVRAVDPAMGAGAFLCETLRALVRRSGEAESPAVRKRIAERSIFGIDVDELAVLAARRALWLTVGDRDLPLDAFDANLVHADALLDARSWEQLFPSVFAEGRGGFDLVVANPPFLGGKRIRTVHGDAYTERLAALHGTNKNVDLAAHFLRRSFDGLRPAGVLGFVTTNTIAQGDTREGGLATILRSGGTLYAADRSVHWPGDAGVVTSLIWIKKGEARQSALLDGEPVARIDGFLSPHGRSGDPERIDTMKKRAFIGCFLRGAGFIFDDATKGATPISTMRGILRARPSSGAVVKPFMGGDEALTHPAQKPHRFVIHFGDMTLDEARAEHPELLAIVEEKVRPFRESKRATAADALHRRTWWQFANTRPELARTSRGLARVIGIPRVSAHVVAAFLETGVVHSDQLVLVASDSPAVLALLSSSVHVAWARQTCSTLGKGLRYTPSDAFETLVIPFGRFEDLAADASLRSAGEAFHECRSQVLAQRGIGLSKLLRTLEDPRRDAADLARLRDVTAALDRAVLGAYGWSDLDPANHGAIVERLFALHDDRSDRARSR